MGIRPFCTIDEVFLAKWLWRFLEIGKCFENVLSKIKCGVETREVRSVEVSGGFEVEWM